MCVSAAITDCIDNHDSAPSKHSIVRWEPSEAIKNSRVKANQYPGTTATTAKAKDVTDKAF